MRNICILILLIISFVSSARVGLGTLTTSANRYQTDTQGSTELFEINPYLSIDGMFPILSNIFFIPEFGITFDRDTEEDYSKRTYVFMYNIAHKVLSGRTLLKWGLGNYITRIRHNSQKKLYGDGGDKFLFFGGDDASLSYNTTLNLGAEQLLTPKFSARLDFSILAPLSSKKRGVNYILGVNYHY